MLKEDTSTQDLLSRPKDKDLNYNYASAPALQITAMQAAKQ